MNEPIPEAPSAVAKGRGGLPWLLLLAALLHGLAFLFVLPPWMGEDEPWHVEYVHYVAEGHMPWGGRAISIEDLSEYSPSQVQVLRELGGLEREELVGTQTAILDSMRAHGFWERVDWAAWGGQAESFDQVSPYFTATHQPPAYYVLAGTLARLLGGGNVLQEMWVVRGLALLCYLAVVLAAHALALRIAADGRWAVLVGLLVAWWPMHARQAAVVNNDVLVKVLTAWTLVVALDLAAEGFTRRRVLLALVLAVGGLAVKTTAVGVLVPLGLAVLWRLRRGRRLLPGRARPWLWVAVVGLVLAVPVAYQFTNNPAIPLRLDNFLLRLQRAVQPEFRGEFLRTAIGAFNWYSRDLPGVVHRAVEWTLLLSGLGLLFVLLRRADEVRRGLLLLCLSAVAAQLLLVFLRGQAAGRYAIPVLPACAALVGCGLYFPLPRAWRGAAVGLVVAALLAFDAYFLGSGLVWNQYGVWGS